MVVSVNRSYCHKTRFTKPITGRGLPRNAFKIIFLFKKKFFQLELQQQLNEQAREIEAQNEEIRNLRLEINQLSQMVILDNLIRWRQNVSYSSLKCV